MKTTKIILVLLFAITTVAFGQKTKGLPIKPPPPLPEMGPHFADDYFTWRLKKDTSLPANVPYDKTFVFQDDNSARLIIQSNPDAFMYKAKNGADKDRKVVLHTISYQYIDYDVVSIKGTLVLLKDIKDHKTVKLKITKREGKIIQLQDLDTQMIYQKNEETREYLPTPSL